MDDIIDELESVRITAGMSTRELSSRAGLTPSQQRCLVIRS